MRSIRFKLLFFSVLLFGKMGLFAQDSNGLYPVYDFSLRNAVTDCFHALWLGESRIDCLLLSNTAVEGDSDFPEIVGIMLKTSKAELPLSTTLSPVKPYVGYDYRYLMHKDITYVIGMAVAETNNANQDVSNSMIARPLYFVFTNMGWRAFWIGHRWLEARFAGKDRLVVRSPADSTEIAVSEMVSNLREEFYAQLIDNGQSRDNPETTSPLMSHESERMTVEKKDSSLTKQPISYDKATVKPTFGGQEASSFSEWIRCFFKYPESARRQGLTGTAKVKFVIDSSGNVTDVQVVESLGKRTKEEFENQIKMASFICGQYRSQLDKLVENKMAIASIMEVQKLYEQAQQRLGRLRKLAANRNYVLPEYAVLDKELKRVISSSPQWEPGEYYNHVVPVECILDVVISP